MSINAITVGTVRERERERERELHFSNRKCGIVQQSDTSRLLVNNNRINIDKKIVIEPKK